MFLMSEISYKCSHRLCSYPVVIGICVTVAQRNFALCYTAYLRVHQTAPAIIFAMAAKEIKNTLKNARECIKNKDYKEAFKHCKVLFTIIHYFVSPINFYNLLSKVAIKFTVKFSGDRHASISIFTFLMCGITNSDYASLVLEFEFITLSVLICSYCSIVREALLH